ncbi:hypothetical protein FRC11_001517 [Ceratobasidium sp. 423]|nr:hypothetical protein FRC11_001517 [Ceratobasidium sp. 423]
MAESPIPGTYTIHDTDSGQLLSYHWGNAYSNKVGSWTNMRGEFQKWYVKCYPGSSRHAIQNVRYKKYIGVNTDEDKHPYGVEEEDAAILELVHQSQNSYFDDVGSPLKPRPEATATPPVASPVASPVPQSNNLLSPDSGSLYTDDAHFYTDLLFNMPRSPFSRTQRIAALDWARKLGATNVPTMESFDECEGRLEAASGSNNNPPRNE